MKIKKVPQRQCLGCDIQKDKKELIRIVRSPEGDISIDKVGKKPGRGAYVCPCAECVAKAIKTKRIERSLEIKLTEEMKEELLKELAE